ncbi:hypothetical protein [Thermanaeromonas sp. C210]|uniref:hypothetical protein n=1 Tax=Thermanaeromonas sp. C210 TaxID=2731925 RepID=UPI00155B6D13|nr:hypothetical protein [Thermanaeromonas sp. C210]GFN23381.1 hypothetical protein TAMC210_16980 [Thermanaeromonas sp. C210]
MGLDKERLLGLAYRLLEEPGWPGAADRAGQTAINTVAGIFREFSRLPAGADRLKQALSLIEALPGSPLARYSMRNQYQRILEILQVRNGRVNHPAIKELSFEELAYVIGWVSRLHRAMAAGVKASAAKVSGKDKRQKGASTREPEKTSKSGVEVIDPRWKALKDWPGFKKT